MRYNSAVLRVLAWVYAAGFVGVFVPLSFKAIVIVYGLDVLTGIFLSRGSPVARSV